jgi:putative chitinase
MSFDFDFTQEKLAECLHRNKNIPDLFEALCNVFPRYEITTVDRVAAFLAQCGHESVDFTVLQENLNYSAEGLTKVFPKRFPTLESAQPLHRNPEAIANSIYASRMGNGGPESGDGWKFRGRGAIQLTGRENYTKFANSIEMDVDDAVAYTETIQGAIESACWFWNTRNLNALADEREITKMTKVINGGTLGLEERKQHFIHNLHVLSGQ